MSTIASERRWVRPDGTSRATKAKERVIHGLLALSLLAVVLPVLWVIFFLVQRGINAITHPGFLTTLPTRGLTEGGILPAIVGTLALVLLTALIAVPVGVLAAVYLTEYARQNIVTRAIRLAIINLAGVPSIVFGLFGYGLFVLGVTVAHSNGVPIFTIGGFKVSLLSGALTLAVLVLPMVITAAEEALHTVPPMFREASLGLGSSKWQTIWHVVLPTALPGILTGIILSVGRAAGETAPILLTCVALNTGAGGMLRIQEWTPGGVGQGFWDFVMSPVQSLSYLLYAGTNQIPESKNLTPGALTLSDRNWGVALTLLIIVLGMNMIAMVLRGILRGRRKW